MRPDIISVFARLCLVLIGIAGFCIICFANPEISTTEDDSTVIVGDAPEEKVYVFGRSVIVKKHAAEVLAVGGDVDIEGRVDGDVATIGGNITQREGAYIGGDIIVIGGTYKSESQSPLREFGKQTVVFGFLEEQLRNFGQNPSQIFSPSFSLSFLAQRIFVVHCGSSSPRLDDYSSRRGWSLCCPDTIIIVKDMCSRCDSLSYNRWIDNWRPTVLPNYFVSNSGLDGNVSSYSRLCIGPGYTSGQSRKVCPKTFSFS